MRQKVFHSLIMMAVTIFCLCACSENNASKTISPHDIRIKQFLEDAQMSTEIYEKFMKAIKGDMEACE